MDKLTRYGALIKQHMSKLAEWSNPQQTPGVETLCFFDDERGLYMLLDVGWTDKERVHYTSQFARLRNGKIWVEEDWTAPGIVQDLLAAGVPKEDIVLAFQHPEMRPLTEFAVA